MPIGQGLVWLTPGLVILLISSRMQVWGAVNIAHWLSGKCDLVVVALGTGLLEPAGSIVSTLKNQHDIAIGNVLGSNMFNLLAVLVLPGLVRPRPTSPRG